MKKGFSIVEIILAMAILIIIVQTATVTVLNGFGANIRDENNLENNVANKNNLENYINTRNVGITMSGVDNVQKFTSNIGNTLFVYLSNWKKPVPKRGNWGAATIIGSINLPGGNDGEETATRDTYYFGTRRNAGPDLNTYSIIGGTSVNTVSNYSNSNKTFGLALDGDYAYLATSDNAKEFQLVDISNLSSPVASGHLNITPNAAGIDVVSDRANRALMLASSRLYSINTSDKNSPASFGSVAVVATGQDLCVNGNYVYITSSSNTREIQIYDIGTSVPTIAGQLDIPGNDDALSITCMGNNLAVGLNNGTLMMINVSSPTSLSIGSTFDAGGAISAIDHNDDNSLLFLATYNPTMEFQVIDIGNLSSLSRLGSVDLADNALGVAYNIAEDMVIVGCADNNNEYYFIKSGL